MNQTVESVGSRTIPSAAPAARVAATPTQRFVRYALAFEEVLVSNEWDKLHEHFTAGAIRTVTGGGPLAEHSIGRDAVIRDLCSGVAALEGRFDQRLPEIISGPSERDGVVWIDWRLTCQRDGLPDLVVEGTHATHFEGERIRLIEETITNATTLRLEAYFAEHDARLRPPCPTAQARSTRLSRQRMQELVEGYAAAKSRADAAGALAFCDESFFIHTLPFGIASRDRAETAVHLGIFFATFPDYGVEVDDIAFSENCVACCGTARMTLRGSGLGVEPTGKTAAVPFVSWFTFANGLLASEKFHFDLATLCDGIGVAIGDVRRELAALRQSA